MKITAIETLTYLCQIDDAPMFTIVYTEALKTHAVSKLQSLLIPVILQFSSFGIVDTHLLDTPISVWVNLERYINKFSSKEMVRYVIFMRGYKMDFYLINMYNQRLEHEFDENEIDIASLNKMNQSDFDIFRQFASDANVKFVYKHSEKLRPKLEWRMGNVNGREAMNKKPRITGSFAMSYPSDEDDWKSACL
jgi:hypothetical protein